MFTVGLPVTYGDGHEGEPETAIELVGDNVVQVMQNDGLPLYAYAEFTIAMWVKGDGTAQLGDRRVWSESSSLSGTPLFNLGTDDAAATSSLEVYIRGSDGAAATNHVASTSPVFDGEWHHIAWVDRLGSVVLYVDGVPDETNFSYVRPEMLDLDITSIGGIIRSTGQSHMFTGAIDDARVFTHGLSEAEVGELIEGVVEEGVGPFIRGDCNGDGNVIGQVGDAVYVLNFNFTGGPVPTCLAACDSNADGNVIGQVGDAIYTLNFNFLGGPAIPAPFPECATSTAEDDVALGCETPIACP